MSLLVRIGSMLHPAPPVLRRCDFEPCPKCGRYSLSGIRRGNHFADVRCRRCGHERGRVEIPA